jgi:hypothetical protein
MREIEYILIIRKKGCPIIIFWTAFKIYFTELYYYQGGGSFGEADAFLGLPSNVIIPAAVTA